MTSFTINLGLINFGFVGCKVTSLLYEVKTNGELLRIISPLANWSWLEMLKTSQGAGLIAWAVCTGCTLSGATEKS